MKRPFALIGITYLIALLAAIYFGKENSLFIVIGLIICLATCMFFKDIRNKKIIPIALFVAAAGFLVYFVTYSNDVEPISKLDQKDAIISGVICEMPYKDYDRYYYVIETDYISLENSKQKVKLRLSSSTALEADSYDRITANVYMFEPSSGSGYTSKIYYQAQGIFMFAYIDEYKDIKIESTSNKPIYYHVIKFREKLLSSFRIMLPEKEASMVSGILLGDKRGISEEIKSDFRQVGVSHMLAVSGMHLSILAQFLMMALVSFKIPRRYRGLIVSIGVLGFMALTGFSSSIMRAGIMSIIYFSGYIFNRKPDPINSLGFAVLLICLMNPLAASDVGLLLSFSAVLGILLLGNPITKFIKDRVMSPKNENPILKWAIEAFSISIAATLFTSPISMIVFKRVSIVSPIANIIIIFPLAIMIIFALISLILYLIQLSFIAVTFAALAGMTVDYMVWSAHLLAQIPKASLPTNQGFLLVWLSATLIMVSISLFLRVDTKLIKFATILSVIILFIGIFSYQVSRRNVISVAVLDTGNGLSVILNKDGHNAVISSGGEKYYSRNLSNYLDSLNAKNLDYFLISDSAEQTSLYANSIIEEYPPSTLTLCNDSNAIDALSKNINLYNNITYFNKDTNAEIWGKVKVTVKSFEKESYVYLEVNKINFLLSFKEFNEENVPEHWKRPNFFISSANIESLENIKSNYVILSKNLESSTKQINELVSTNPNIVATASDGSIIIDCIKENYVDIRREI